MNEPTLGQLLQHGIRENDISKLISLQWIPTAIFFLTATCIILALVYRPSDSFRNKRIKQVKKHREKEKTEKQTPTNGCGSCNYRCDKSNCNSCYKQSRCKNCANKSWCICNKSGGKK